MIWLILFPFWESRLQILSHLNCEVLKTSIQQSVEICLDSLLDQVGVQAPGDHPDTDEGGQQWTGLEHWLVWECVECGQTYQVTQGLG